MQTFYRNKCFDNVSIISNSNLFDVHYCPYIYLNSMYNSDKLFQRHFAVFAISFPTHEALTTIYTSILTCHLQHIKAHGGLIKLGSNIVDATLYLHTRVCQLFLPTAVRFHYMFNLRDTSNIFQVN